MQFRPGWRAALDPRIHPGSATAACVAAYVLALIAGRALLVAAPRIGAAWPSVAIGFVWLLPYLENRGWWRRRAVWAVLAAMGTLTTAANVVTGMRLDLAATGGACNVVSDVLAVVLYLRWRERDTPYLGSGHDLRRLAFACLVANAAGWFTLPLASVLAGESGWATTGFWYVRNVVSLLYGGLGAALIFRRQPWALRGPGPWVAGAVTLATSGGIVALVLAGVDEALVYIVIIAAVGTAAAFSVMETYLYLCLVGGVVTGLALAGHSPFGPGPSDVVSGHVHTVVFVLLVVAMATVADREGRSQLARELGRERAIAAEEAERSARQADLLGAVIRSMTDGVLVLDELGRVAMRNQAAARLVGLAPADRPAVADPALAEAIERSLTEGPVDLAAPDATCAAGGTTVVVQAWRLDAGSDRATVVALHDVTEERRQVDELRMFARVAAHDLRQPLTAIEVWAGILEEELTDIAPDLDREPLARVLGAADRMDQFLTDLMAYAVARDLPMRSERIELAELAGLVVADRTGTGAAAAAEVTVAAADVVVGDRAQLRQLLDNLVGNALKYARPQVTATVRVTSTSEDGWVVLAVDDAGVGLSAGEEGAIFGEFYRAPEHVRAFPGTGLGLAICRRIVERHGGRITARRSDLGGLRVEVRLPQPTD